ncbi:MAG: hypothetical protein U5L09_16330 [Bacteroidales bacterium]|nr:hypothetical protein [Bacteroidales bacterium]
MTPSTIFISFLIYTVLLLTISWVTSRNAGSDAYFLGNRQSPWYVVAYGMIGASLSGVTFISIPGDVGATQFSYLVIVMGYLVRLLRDCQCVAATLLPDEPHLHLYLSGAPVRILGLTNRGLSIFWSPGLSELPSGCSW